MTTVRRFGAWRGILLALAALLCAAAPAVPEAPAAADASAARAAPRRIVSLAPNLTEMLFAIGAGGQVAGVTDFCDTPAEAAALPSVGGYVNPNPEAVLALAPDLVVATPNVGNRPFVERLMRLGVRVEVVAARNIEEIFPALATLGRATGHEAEAGALAARLRDGIEGWRRRSDGAPRPRALLCIQIEPLVVAGPGSYPHDLLLLAGGASIVPEKAGAYPALSLEEVIRSAPEVIVQTRMDTRGETGAGADPETDARLLSWWSRWSSIPAVATGRVHAVSGDALLRPGPRLLEGIEALARILQPDSAREAPPAPPPGEPR